MAYRGHKSSFDPILELLLKLRTDADADNAWPSYRGD